jgi:hypothetical protein
VVWLTAQISLGLNYRGSVGGSFIYGAFEIAPDTHTHTHAHIYMAFLYVIVTLQLEYFLLSSFSKCITHMDVCISDRICNTIYSVHKTTIITTSKIYNHYQEFVLGYILAT